MRVASCMYTFYSEIVKNRDGPDRCSLTIVIPSAWFNG